MWRYCSRPCRGQIEAKAIDTTWTIDLILTQWPERVSLRDFGSLLRSPWKPSFVPLLGDTLNLDRIEHGRIRAPGSYDEPPLSGLRRPGRNSGRRHPCIRQRGGKPQQHQRNQPEKR